ncbi:MAG: alpha-amylase/4-alpha-glucanotransferase domain-containing protein [Spirochaetaceae bacterium]
MRKVKLIFGTTNSQPIGASDADIEDVYQRSYKPFIRALYNAPHVRATLHYSGRLLQWLERRHAEFTDVLSELVGRKQVELLGGGFYDPIFSLIPRPDRLGQIERLTTYLRKRFGKRPRGLWVTQEVWDPMMPSLLKTSGIDYTFLSDYQFDAGGLTGTPLYSPCITEDEGKMVIVFPISSGLRRACRRNDLDGIRRLLEDAAAENEDRVQVLMCHGEDLRSNTSSQAPFDDEWLRTFFELLEQESSWISTVTPSRYLKKASPRARGYFPQAAFVPERGRRDGAGSDELSRAAQADGYLAGTSFRTLLTRYPESNLMYAKMHYIHILVNQIRGDKYRKQLAREELWRGQCHSAYWNGGDRGGIYSNRQRKHVYASLIEAEKVTRERGIFSPSIITVDFDMDGLSEFLYQGQELNAYVHKRGGVVFELDYLPTPWNYADALSEAWSAQTCPAPKPSSRNIFSDHFFDRSPAASGGSSPQAEELGDFLDRLYSVRHLSKDGHRIHLAAVGAVRSEHGPVALEVHKEYGFEGDTIHVDYRLRNRSETDLCVDFGCELNLSFDAEDGESLRILAGEGSGVTLAGDAEDFIDGIKRVRLHDLQHEVMLELSCQDQAALWTAPIRLGVGDPEGAASAAQYQTSCLLPRWPIDLKAGEEWTQKLELSLLSG